MKVKNTHKGSHWFGKCQNCGKLPQGTVHTVTDGKRYQFGCRECCEYIASNCKEIGEQINPTDGESLRHKVLK
jgi:hypothetical protein